MDYVFFGTVEKRAKYSRLRLGGGVFSEELLGGTIYCLWDAEKICSEVVRKVCATEA